MATCEHLSHAGDPAARTPDGCEECLATGGRWVHLRRCLECGHIGCCDSSPSKHATQHFHVAAHPVVQSFEPGEQWRWGYVDNQMG
ncbi:UBP-type zinc finger domain-containing protein [Nonomuraea sp. 3-1Str]|uniref:UBP-type zinc finger domain-containing protein n=1 Tax=Nonomuraea sp. 3-1Str TaxID=2929801 RepID=UPI00286449D7|nr:UBP-type zinc finger domain-containing protein [Nonomuraea sp. 3-1Str]MDR8412527.1 UBP-type zinc finger domain-containing protein [Nonomuraea sp. 3-1Str]